jgi:hemolysin activation/secretion protein
VTHNQTFILSKTIRWTAVLCALFLWNCLAVPALAAPVKPDTGSILEDVKLPPLVQPPKPAAPPIKIEERRPDQQADDTRPVPVTAFRLKGDLPVPAAELQGVLAGETGKSHTLRGLNELAGRLTTHLRDRGFLLAFAYIPAQEIADGQVDIVIVPGVYGQILIQGNAHLKDSFLRGIFRVAQPGGVIARGPLERALLIANEIPGLEVRSTFAPGRTPGSADLVISAADAGKISGAAYTDNWGSRSTGRVRYGIQAHLNNLSGVGDSFSLGGLTSFEGLNNYDFGYNAYLGTSGLQGYVRHSRVNYTLGGDDFASLNATGKAVVTSAGLSYPLVKSRSFSLTANLGYEHKKLTDETTASSEKRSDNLWTIGLGGQSSDSWGGGGANAFLLSYTHGNLKNDSAAAATADEIAGTAGGFGKWTLNLQRQQFVRKNLQLNLSFAGQLASKNLHSSEKFYLGGSTGVRAYPQSEADGDEGYRFTAEMRYRVPGLSTPKSGFYLAGYFDFGGVLRHKTDYDPTTANWRSLSGVGIGLLWTRDRDYAFRLDYAWKTCGETAADPNENKNGRIWLQAIKYF